MAGLGKDRAGGVKKPLGTNTRVLGWQEIKQCGHLFISHNRSLGHSSRGLVRKHMDVTEVMGSSLSPVLHPSYVRQLVSPWAALAPSITSSHDSVPSREVRGEQRGL